MQNKTFSRINNDLTQPDLSSLKIYPSKQYVKQG